jgi:hypothetical protein
VDWQFGGWSGVATLEWRDGWDHEGKEEMISVSLKTLKLPLLMLGEEPDDDQQHSPVEDEKSMLVMILPVAS